MFAKAASRIAFVIASLAGLLHVPPAAAQLVQDVVTVATVSGFGTVDVPVYIRDVSGTSLGIDQPPGSRIQSYSIKVNYTPGVSSVTFSRAGITAALTPSFETSPSSAGSIALLGNFQESTNLIPFTLNAAIPGNQVAHLLVTIPQAVAPGTVISLTLDPALTQLADEAGSPATVETAGNARLALVNGSITVLAPPASPAIPIPALGVMAFLVLAISVGLVAMKVRSARLT
jgi:hypothetical protein